MRQTSATELAKMGKQEHEQFNRQLSGKDKRCFIATAVFGIDAIETNILRQFRDNHLIPYTLGRMFTSLYYSISPYIVIVIDKYPVLMIPIRAALRWFIRSWR
ncbi:CFI-box-CTERM domain-containing protein [Pelosinus fermentans]|uniref:Uncharacterized protein n=1 Tax=Pelosinus fermentans JBW45 TaxID=1192197 RepID=I9NSG8_9FIRM|nr:CFI-box-CTERM domain-containing protein [Pelosinus fermentans]AJQ27562.1 hypothetical protein JBW_02216 [Pelosinus fermentans JBW45]